MNFKQYATHSVLSLMIAGTALVHPYGTAFATTPTAPSAQCTQARANVASHEKALETLKARHSELMKKLDAEKEARAQAEHKLAELDKAAEANKDKIAQAQNAIDRATAKIKQLESMIDQLNKALDKQTQELEKAKTALAVAQKNLDAIAADRDKTRTEVSKIEEAVKHSKSEVAAAEKALQDEKDRYNSAVAEQKQKINETNDALKKATDELETAEKTLPGLNEPLYEAQAARLRALDALSSSRKRSVEKINKSHELMEGLKSLVTQQAAEVAKKNEIDAEIAKIDEKIKELSGSNQDSSKNAQITELTVQRQKQAAYLQLQSENLATVNYLVANTEKALAELKKEIRIVSDEVRSDEQVLKKAIRDLAQAEQAIEDLRTNINVLPKKIEALKNELAKLDKPISNNIAAREQEVEMAKKQLVPLQERLNDEQVHLEKLQAEYGEALAAKEAQEQKVNLQTQQVEKLRKTRDKTQVDLGKAQRELDDAHKVHNQAIAELDSLKKQIADAQRSLDLIGDSSAELKKIANELETKRILHSNSVKTEKERCAPKQLMPKHPEPMAPEPTQPAPAQPIQKTAPASVQNKASAQLAQTGVAPGEALLGAGALIGLGALAAGVSRRRRQA